MNNRINVVVDGAMSCINIYRKAMNIDITNNADRERYRKVMTNAAASVCTRHAWKVMRCNDIHLRQLGAAIAFTVANGYTPSGYESLLNTATPARV